MPMVFGPGDMDDLPEELVEALQAVVGKTKHGEKRGFGREKLLPEVMRVRIEEASALYAASLHACPYAIGDWVTARRGYGIKGAGRLYQVVDRIAFPPPDFETGDPSTQSNGRRVDMRVMTMIQDEIICFWAESYQYEPYNDKLHAGVEG